MTLCHVGHLGLIKPSNPGFLSSNPCSMRAFTSHCYLLVALHCLISSKLKKFACHCYHHTSKFSLVKFDEYV